MGLQNGFESIVESKQMVACLRVSQYGMYSSTAAQQAKARAGIGRQRGRRIRQKRRNLRSDGRSILSSEWAPIMLSKQHLLSILHLVVWLQQQCLPLPSVMSGQYDGAIVRSCSRQYTFSFSSAFFGTKKVAGRPFELMVHRTEHISEKTLSSSVMYQFQGTWSIFKVLPIRFLLEDKG